MKTATHSIVMRKEHLQYQAVLMKRKVTALIAFTTTIFLLCIENVKAFAAPFSSPDTLMMLATGAHSLAKRWKNSNNCSHISTDSRPTSSNPPNSKNACSRSALMVATRDTSIARSHIKSVTSLKMAFGFGVPAMSPTPSPTMPDMKSSMNTFGFWYNQMDPVARPPVYDDDVTDYSFTSPADTWPSSFDNDAVVSVSVSSKKSRRPRPIRAIRKIAGWVFGSPAGKHARGLGAQSFL